MALRPGHLPAYLPPRRAPATTPATSALFSLLTLFSLFAPVVLAALLPLHAAHAAGPTTDPKVEFSGSITPAAARAGEHVLLEIAAKIPEGYHLYSLTKIEDGPLALSFPVDEAALIPATPWFAPAPEVSFDTNFKTVVEFYTDEVTHLRVFRFDPTGPAGAAAPDPAGSRTLTMTLRGQICDEHQCLAFKEALELPFALEAGEARTEFSEIPALGGEPFPDDRPAPSDGASAQDAAITPATGAAGLANEGMISFLVIAFLAGLGALITPCVFPMIPITIGFFSKFSKVSLRRTISMATIYSLSIIGTFTLVGVLVSLIFGAVGMQAISASIFFNAFLAILLVVFAYNLFGLFEIQVPSFLIAKTSKKERELKKDGAFGKQALGVFFMGLTFTLISFTCTVGFIGVVLAEAAKGNWFYPAIGMLTFSLAFSLPFFFLAVFPSWADRLKGRAGDWMVSVKVVLGFLELAGSFKFISNVDLLLGWGMITRPLVLAIWTAIFFVAGLYLLKVMRLGDDHEPRAVGPIRMTFAIMLLVLSAYSSTGIRDTKSMGGWIDGWLPPAVYPGQEVRSKGGDDPQEFAWIKDDIPAGMTQGRDSDQPVFVDFTGYTCTNCRYMEASVFPRPEIHAQLAQMVRVTAYTDCIEDVCDAQREYQVERFETAALPFYAIIDPHTDKTLATFASSTNDPAVFEQFLKGGLDAFQKAHRGERRKRSRDGRDSHGEAADAGAGPVADVGAPPSESAGVSVVLAKEGDPVDFTFPLLESGEPFSLASLRGDWVFINYWASWCAPCKKELTHDFPPALGRAPHIKMITVAFDGDETRTQAIKFAQEVDLLKYPTLQGGDDAEEAGLPPTLVGGATLPQSYLIDPAGHVAWSHIGSVDEALLDRLFAAAAKSTGLPSP